MKSNRIETLSDGIFAIVMTLLVLEIKVPRVDLTHGESLLTSVISLYPHFISYIISFIMLGIYWIGHHNQMHYIKKVDRTFLWLNLSFFLTISMIPFSAALLGEYPKEQLSILIYGLNLILSGMMLYLIWNWAVSKKLTIKITPKFRRFVNTRILLAPIIYSLALVVSFINLSLSFLLFFIPILFYILPGKVDRLLKE